MSLRAKISDDIKAAMKAQDKSRLQTLRMMLSELKYAQANANVHEDLPEAEETKVLATYHKRLEKSLADYPEGDAKAAIRGEIKLVEQYLPKRIDREVIEQLSSIICKIVKNDNLACL